MAATCLPAGATTPRISSRVGTLDNLNLFNRTTSAGSASNIPQVMQRKSAAVDEQQQPIQERFNAATRRMERTMEVNARLQSALVKRHMQAQEIKAELESLDVRIDSCRNVEEPARMAALEALESEIKEEQRRLQESSLELGRGIMDLDERVAALSAGNATMRETSTRRRAMLKEQQSELRAQQRAVRSLSRHIQIMEEGADYDQLTGWSLSEVRMPDGQTFDPEMPDEEVLGTDAAAGTPAVEQGANLPPTTGAAKFLGSDPFVQTQPQTIEDYKKLPGLDLQLLLGHANSML